MQAFAWTHQHFPNLLDCRPICVRRAVETAGFSIKDATVKHTWGPVEIVKQGNSHVNVIKRDTGSLQHYLIEISRIPLLTRQEEIAWPNASTSSRKRLYRGILATGHGLQAIVTLLHPVCRGTMRLDRVVELPRPGASENRRILEYLKPTVGVLQGLLAENQTDFALIS